MTDTDTRAGLDLAAIDRWHQPDPANPRACKRDHATWPCEATLLLAEVKRLQAVATGAPAIRRAAERVKAARTAPEQLEAAQDLARLVRALDAPAPPQVAGEATQSPNPASSAPPTPIHPEADRGDHQGEC